VYNIVPVDDNAAARDHPAVKFPEVKAAVRALRSIGDLRRPPQWRTGISVDVLDWLGYWFGFQDSNVKNQREHLVLLLANAQMRATPESADKVEMFGPHT